MTTENESDSIDSCGCRIDIFPTDTNCPLCGKRLRLTGRAQRMELRLSCQHCDYQSSLLSQEELQAIL